MTHRHLIPLLIAGKLALLVTLALPPLGSAFQDSARKIVAKAAS